MIDKRRNPAIYKQHEWISVEAEWNGEKMISVESLIGSKIVKLIKQQISNLIFQSWEEWKKEEVVVRGVAEDSCKMDKSWRSALQHRACS